MGRIGTLIQHLRRLVAPAVGQPDAQLLERFLSGRDDVAFEVLLWRHGPMVLGVCRRILHNEQDVEDAFQATFLALVRKARSISRRESLGSWLYKVAYRVALRARAASARRARREQPLSDVPDPRPADPADGYDLRSLLDEEVGHLPERYRLPFVLCYLQGKTHEEAARELGCAPGTVSYRLWWARERLRSRLTRRGLTLSAVAFVGLLSQNAAPAQVSGALVHSTLTAALPCAAGRAAAASAQVAALTEGVLRTMLLAKVKVAAAVVLAVTLVGAGGALSYRGRAVMRAAAPDAPRDTFAQKDRARDERSDPQKQLREAHDRIAQLELSLLESDRTVERLRVQVNLLRQGRVEEADAVLAPPKMPGAVARVRSVLALPSRPQDVEDLRDEIELLEVQLEGKEVEVRAAQVTAAALNAELKRLEREVQRGVVSSQVVDATRVKAEAAGNQLMAKKIAVKEVQVRLKQARRRLARLEKGAGRAGGPARTREERLLELEKKLDALRKEAEALRREARPTRR